MSKLLVVDDEIEILRMMKDHFSARGAVIFTAKTAEEGYWLAFKERPDLAFLDLGVPDFSGELLLKRIKQSFPGMKVIVVSAKAEEGLEERLRTLGSDAYFEKGSATLLALDRKVKELMKLERGDLGGGYE